MSKTNKIFLKEVSDSNENYMPCIEITRHNYDELVIGGFMDQYTFYEVIENETETLKDVKTDLDKKTLIDQHANIIAKYPKRNLKFNSKETNTNQPEHFIQNNGIIGRIYPQITGYDDKTGELFISNINHEVNPDTGFETGKVETLAKYVIKAKEVPNGVNVPDEFIKDNTSTFEIEPEKFYYIHRSLRKTPGKELYVKPPVYNYCNRCTCSFTVNKKEAFIDNESIAIKIRDLLNKDRQGKRFLWVISELKPE